jgi:hypothetical protein
MVIQEYQIQVHILDPEDTLYVGLMMMDIFGYTVGKDQVS